MRKFTKLRLLNMVLGLFIASSATSQQLSPSQKEAIFKTGRGQITQLPDFIEADFPLIEYEKTILPGPQFLISDDPEYIEVPEGIAMQESVSPGAVRLYIYNVNGVESPSKMPRKITAVITNNGTHSMQLRMLKYSSQDPSANYFKIGKEGLAEYFASNENNKVITIAPGESKPIDSKLEEQIVQYNELVHGFYDFVIDQPAEISILQTSPETAGPEALERIKDVLPPKSHSGAGRGLFGVSNYEIENKSVIDTKDGPVQLIIADGELDPWIAGREGSTGNRAHLAGNYGVIYNIDLEWKSTDGKGLALLTWNSRSADNRWCGGMAASMIISEGKFEEGIIQLPSDQLITRKAPEAIVVQIFEPKGDGQTQHINLTYSPPGASCLPTPLIFVPIDLPQK